YSVLMQAQAINVKVVGANRKTVISLDMGLYQPAKKLQMSRADLNHMILRPGELHIVMAQLRTLGAFIKNSSIDMAWVESRHFSSRSHTHARFTLNSWQSSWVRHALVEEAHEEMVNTMKTIGILDKMKAFDEVHDNNPMFKVFHHYMQMVLEMPMFIRAVHT
ncbi:hypothetical protein QZH41_013574, partial [Actinostola sp. cb2023]